jgi:hypothetical protein
MAARLLLKTTIGPVADDWNVGRFSRLAARLADARDDGGARLYEVVARNRSDGDEDADLRAAAGGGFDQLWLFAVDTGEGITPADAEAIKAFRARGGGLLLTRDHQDLGCSLARLGAIGLTQHFQRLNPEDESGRRASDDIETPSITWPNYHSGPNGDVQSIEAGEPPHPLMRRRSGEPLALLPAHPHEGAVCAPEVLGAAAQIVALGRSRTTGRHFNLCVAVEEPGQGRVVSDSSFHHFCDYNWDPRLGCPSFVTEPAADVVVRTPGSLDDTHRYVENIAAWLAGRA